MSYTKHFAATIRDHGMINLSPTQFRRMMNIVYLEGKLDQLKIIKKDLPPEEERKYDIQLFKLNSQLTEQTGNLPPGELVREMVGRS